MTTIDTFEGQHAFLSNFFASPIVVGNIRYPTVEHAYQAAKACPSNPRCEELRMRFATLPTPGEAKRAGREIMLRPGWDDGLKIRVMRVCLMMKFRPGSELAARLLATGDATLIEGNDWHDTYWGVCKGVGENHLGLLLMETRGVLLGTAQPERAA